MTIKDIITRLKAATGPDLGLDCWIENVLGLAVFERDTKVGYGDADYARVTPRPLTASMDAALALTEKLLPGWDVGLSNNPWEFYVSKPRDGRDDNIIWRRAHAPSAPLAILIATLTAYG